MGSSVSLFFMLASLIFIAAGCKTVPEIRRDLPDVVAGRGDILFYFNLEKDRRIVEYVLSRKDSDLDYEKFLNRTERVLLSVQENGIIAAAAEGSYPYAVSNWILCGSKEWKQHKDSYIWWENRDTGEAVSVPVNNFALYSSMGLSSELIRLKKGDFGLLPEELKEGIKDNSLVVYSVNPKMDPASFLGLGRTGTEVEKVNLVLKYEQQSGSGLLLYRMSGYIVFGNEKNALAFNSAFKIGLLSFARKIGPDAVKDLIKNKRFYLEGKRIIFDGVLLNIPDLVEGTDK